MLHFPANIILAVTYFRDPGVVNELAPMEKLEFVLKNTFFGSFEAFLKWKFRLSKICKLNYCFSVELCRLYRGKKNSKNGTKLAR